MKKPERKQEYVNIAVLINNGRYQQAYESVLNMAAHEGLFILSQYKGDAAPELLEALIKCNNILKGKDVINAAQALSFTASVDDLIKQASKR